MVKSNTEIWSVRLWPMLWYGGNWQRLCMQNSEITSTRVKNCIDEDRHNVQVSYVGPLYDPCLNFLWYRKLFQHTSYEILTSFLGQDDISSAILWYSPTSSIVIKAPSSPPTKIILFLSIHLSPVDRSDLYLPPMKFKIQDVLFTALF